MQRVTTEEVLRIVYFARERGEQPDLSGLDMRGLDLRECDMRWSNLSGCDMRGTNLSGANLIGCDFRGSNLSECVMIGANLGECDMRWSNLTKAIVIGCYLIGCDFRGANLSGSDMRECKGLPRPIKYEDVRLGMVVERRKGDYYVGGRVATIDDFYILTDTSTPLWYASWSADGDWSLWLIEDVAEDQLQIL